MSCTHSTARQLADGALRTPTRPTAEFAQASPSSDQARRGAFAVVVVNLSPRASWLSVAGKLSGQAAATRLEDALALQLDAGRCFAGVDLTHVSIVDRYSFDVLVDANRLFERAAGNLVVTGAAPRIARLFELCGLDHMLLARADGDRGSSAPADPAPSRGASADAPSDRDVSATASRLVARVTSHGSLERDRALIDLAVGIVMGQAHTSVPDATQRLLVLAQTTNRSLGDVATSIVDSTTRRARLGGRLRLVHDSGAPPASSGASATLTDGPQRRRAGKASTNATEEEGASGS